MNSKPDWQAVHEELLAEERRRAGDVSTEELLAYIRGELPEEQAERARDYLVANPDIARVMTSPFPDDGAMPGEPGYVSDEELSKRWHSLQKAMHVANGDARVRPSGRTLPFWRRATAALAAALAIVVGGSVWQWVAVRRQSLQPRPVGEEIVLRPQEGHRGPGQPTAAVSTSAETLLLVLEAADERRFSEYRLDIFDTANPSKPIWSTTQLRRLDSGTFQAFFLREFFAPGRYQLVLFGLDGGAPERLGSYVLQVPAR